jgi:hypothetical protein
MRRFIAALLLVAAPLGAALAELDTRMPPGRRS